MKHTTIFLLPLLLLLALAGCSEELLGLANGDDDGLKDGEPFTLRIPVEVPETEASGTRSFDETFLNDTAARHKAGIILLAFDKNHFFTNAYKGVYESTEKQENGTYYTYYEVTLNKTSDLRYFHILVNHTDLESKLNDIPYDTESDIFNSDLMIVGKERNVYWERIQMDAVTPEIAAEKLKHLKLIRNFGRIKLHVDIPENQGVGYLKDITWGLANVPVFGTVAPYMHDQEFADYLIGEGDDAVLADYATLTESGYTGHVPRNKNNADSFYGVTDPDDIVWKEQTTNLYTFENEGTGTSDTYKETMILIKATYVKSNGTADANPTYYRVTLVDPKTYAQLNLLRDVSYDITINGVSDSGYETALEAMNRPANNNISGSTITSSYPTIMSGTQALRVEYLRKYILTPDTFSLQYRFAKDVTKFDANSTVTGTDPQNDLVEITDNRNDPLAKETTTQTTTETSAATRALVYDDDKWIEITNENVNSVLAYYSTEGQGDEEDKFRRIVFKPAAIPTDGLNKTATIRLKAKDTDLYRDVEFVLRPRYSLQHPVIVRDDTYSGHNSGTTDGTYETGNKTDFTLTVDIPTNLPKEIFPLTFTFETQPAVLYPNTLRSIMEANGTDYSIFDWSTRNSFHFHRSVTRDAYNTILTGHGYGGFTESYTGDSETTGDENLHYGYKQISFFFKLNTMLLKTLLDSNSSAIIRFGIYCNEFSPSPTDDAGKSTPGIVDCYYKFTLEDETNNIYKIDPVTDSSNLTKNENGTYSVSTTGN
jgi:hypothetical protein